MLKNKKAREHLPTRPAVNQDVLERPAGRRAFSGNIKRSKRSEMVENS